jgi:hypothetical protein
MKKKVIIIVIIIAALAAAIIIGSYFYPPPEGSDTSGTIGKAEKFRKGQFTEDDILLRDDILNDTAAVGKTLDQVLAFSSFMIQEKIVIDTLWIAQIKKTCPTYPDCPECAYCYQAITMLQDYSDFLKNKEETVKTTVEILLAAYNGKSKEITFDVGVKLLSFVQFIDEMVARDSVLTNSIKLVDQYISKGKVTDKKRQAEITRLKKVRDHMVIDNLLFAARTGDKKQSEMVASMPLSSSSDIISGFVTVQSSGTGFAENIPTNQAVSELENLPELGVFLNLPNIGVYGEGRLDNAVTNNSIVTIGSNNYVTYNIPTYNNVLQLNDVVSNVSPVASANTLDNLIGEGYSNVLSSAPIDLFGSTTGTIFNSDVIGILIEPY